jgi:4-amino-4-deoxy-L-arabinose transferase-like glycosyltransferase
VVLLFVVAGISLVLRLAFLSTPQFLIFDEHYYVNAARKIVSVPVPAGIYADAPAGLDPNGSHPGLAKSIIAGSIKVLGDRPFAWRLPSVIFGTGAILAIYWVSRLTGAGPWAGLGAAGLAALDTLFFLHSRVGTLDIFAVTFMILSVGFYLKKRPVLSGLMLGLGASAKLVALFVLLIIGLMELFKVVLEARERTLDLKAKAQEAVSVALLGSVAVAMLLSFTYVYDRNFYNSTHPVRHTIRMLTNVSGGKSDPSLQALRDKGKEANERAAGQNPEVFRRQTQKVRGAPQARPLEWLLNRKAINYLKVSSKQGEFRSWTLLGQKTSDLMAFTAVMNPAIIFLAIPALLFCAYSAWRWRDPGQFLPVAWFLGTFGPFLVADLAGVPRPGFIYYMVIVLPGIYLAISELFSGKKVAPIYVPALVLSAVVCFWIYYPFRTWGGV